MPLLVDFVAADAGPWRIDRVDTVSGDGLERGERLGMTEGVPGPGRWVLRGTTSNTRYTNRMEVDALVQRQ